MAEREGRLAVVRALVDLQPSASGDAEGMMGWLQRLCGAAVRALPASGAGVSVMTEDGVTGIVAVSDPLSEVLEELQVTLGEGPCVDAFHSRRPVLETDLSGGAVARWPAYSRAAHSEGVRAVFAFPLQVGAARLGVLDVYRQDPDPLSTEALALALAFAEVAVQALLDEPNGAAAGRHGALDEAMGYRTEIYQAQGMVMVDLSVSLNDAMVRLRAYAYAHERRLSDVAQDVVAGRLRLESDHQW